MPGFFFFNSREHSSFLTLAKAGKSRIGTYQRSTKNGKTSQPERGFEPLIFAHSSFLTLA